MSIVKEFREFAIKGNVVDLAVGVIIGAAFGKIVASVVSDVFMPLLGTLLGTLLGGVDFSGLSVEFRDAKIQYGKFLQTLVDFLIIAFAIFLAVKVINRLKRSEEAKPPAPPRQEKLLEEIRDLLKKK